MALPALDMEAWSGIAGSISIACWVVVFSPQIIENFRRSSAEGLSIVFIVVWLVGDIFNILGAVLQGVLPTMIILALYYTIADVVLLAQCFYYRGFTLKDDAPAPAAPPNGHLIDERSALLSRDGSQGSPDVASMLRQHNASSSRRSSDALREHLANLDGVHFSPATPLHSPRRDGAALSGESPMQKSTPWLKAFLFNLAAVVVVCAAGAFGWYLSVYAANSKHGHRKHTDHKAEDPLEFDVLAQTFGYLCTVFYLGSRVPQLLLNYRRKSTEGLSILFFLFACIGNATYVLSIFFYEAPCVKASRKHDVCAPGERDEVYQRYILVNLSWIIGSAGTLVLDGFVFVQYFIYRGNKGASDSAIE